MCVVILYWWMCALCCTGCDLAHFCVLDGCRFCRRSRIRGDISNFLVLYGSLGYDYDYVVNAISLVGRCWTRRTPMTVMIKNRRAGTETPRQRDRWRAHATLEGSRKRSSLRNVELNFRHLARQMGIMYTQLVVGRTCGHQARAGFAHRCPLARPVNNTSP